MREKRKSDIARSDSITMNKQWKVIGTKELKEKIEITDSTA